MLSFSTDVDLAKYEPSVFGSWFLSSQVLCSGSNGIVAGTAVALELMTKIMKAR